MSKNVKFKVEKRSYPKNSAIVDIDVDDGVQEVTFGGDTCLDVDLYDGELPASKEAGFRRN